MKKILLFGDSIRMGYDEYVRESFEGLATVFFPAENCTFTVNYLRNLHNWVEHRDLYDADVVHFNAGLWDTVRIYGDEPLVKLDAYTDNIGRIIDRMHFLFPNATLIFATSTPGLEDEYISDFETRRNSDVEKYNAAAVEVCKQKGVIVNDLYTLLKDCPESFHSDQTHFYTAEATERIGSRVNAFLCEALGIDASSLTVPDKEKYERRDKGIPDKLFYQKNGRYYETKR